MKILLFPHSCIPFHAKTLEERPLGGTETGIIRLAEELTKLGHELSILTPIEAPPLSNPLYIPMSGLQHLGPVDATIIVRGWQPAFVEIESKARFFWTGDSFDQLASFGLGDARVIDRIDGLLCVSEWHKRTLSAASGFPENKTFNLKNGVHLPLFKDSSITRRSKRLIYSSTPYRGLKFVPRIFKKLLETHPDAELVICSGFKVYEGAGGQPEEALAELREIKQELESLPSCSFKGNITQSELANEFQEASILCYPNTFAETSCITVLEAKAAGCIPITTFRAALPETVGTGGILIRGEPGTDTYEKNFLDAINQVFTSASFAENLRAQARLEASKQGWDAIAKNFISIHESLSN